MAFLLLLVLLSGSLKGVAQGVGDAALFPELSGVGSVRTTASDKKETEGEKLTDNSKIEVAEQEKHEEDLFKEIPSPLSSVKTEESKDIEKVDTKDDKNRYIYITLDDLRATLTPNRNSSFCSATFKVTNDLKTEVKSFSGHFTIGHMTKDFRFGNIRKEQSVTDRYMFVGKSCEEILNEPAYDIQTCEVEGWSEKKCKSKVKFVPISKEESML